MLEVNELIENLKTKEFHSSENWDLLKRNIEVGRNFASLLLKQDCWCDSPENVDWIGQVCVVRACAESHIGYLLG